jgi:hypothetical protein
MLSVVLAAALHFTCSQQQVKFNMHRTGVYYHLLSSATAAAEGAAAAATAAVRQRASRGCAAACSSCKLSGFSS